MSRLVGVLMGGWSVEREISLISGAAVSRALRNAGYQVTSIDVKRDAGALLGRLFPRPDAVFNALHGRFGEDGCIQGLLNILEIPYTHSGLLASSLAMDKPMAKRILGAAGIPVAPHEILGRDQLLASEVMDPPFVIKPLNEGSSVGVHIVFDKDDLAEIAEKWRFGSQVMAEQFIAGRELTVAVMGGKPLGVTEITTDRLFYDYEAKYATKGSAHELPAPVPQGVYQDAKDIAVLAHNTLGCRGISRADLRYDGEKIFILEVNTQPGMTPTSLVPEQAAHANISFENLVTWLVENATCDG